MMAILTPEYVIINMKKIHILKLFVRKQWLCHTTKAAKNQKSLNYLAEHSHIFIVQQNHCHHLDIYRATVS